MLFDLFKACVLGIVEGLTEFLPVSSTGHLLLMDHFFGFDDDAFGKAFVVLIQLGAILALLSIYSIRLWNIAMALPTDPAARRFVIGVLIAFLPAAVIGALAYGVIKGVLFNAWVVCSMLILAASCSCGSTASTSSHATTTRRASRCPCISASAWCNASPWFPASRARVRPSSEPCCSAPTAARRRSSRSTSPCRPWWGLSPSRCTRAGR